MQSLHITLKLPSKGAPITIKWGLAIYELFHGWCSPDCGFVLQVREDGLDLLLIMVLHCHSILIDGIQCSTLNFSLYSESDQKLSSVAALLSLKGRGLLDGFSLGEIAG